MNDHNVCLSVMQKLCVITYYYNFYNFGAISNPSGQVQNKNGPVKKKSGHVNLFANFIH